MPLTKLPNEIIICIAEGHLSDASDVFSLLLTCRLFANLLPASLDRLALTDRYLKQALCFAAAHQNEDRLEVLVQKGQKLHALHFIGRPGSTRSAQKPRKCSKQLVRYIMGQGANLAIQEFYKRPSLGWTTLLHFAVCNQHVGMVEALLAKGASTETLDADGLTALQLATSIRRTPTERPDAIVKLLLDHGADAAAESVGDTAPLALAIMSGNAYQVGLMSPPRNISRRFRVSGEEGRWGVLNIAAECGSIDIARLLIEKGADLDMLSNVGTPLHHAVRKGHLKLSKLLIDKGAIIDKGGALARTPLHFAILWGRDIVNLLLDHGAGINLVDSTGWTALHYLVRKHPQPQFIKLLVKRGADPTIQNGYGATPLHVAIRSHMGENVKTILDLSPDECLSMRDHSGDTPLYSARFAPGAEYFVQHLLLRDPDITFFRGDGAPALQIAVEWGGFDLVGRILARHGPKHPSINAQDNRGRTALHFAARRGCKSATKQLVAYGADLSIRDQSYQTPLHYAVRSSAVTTEILLAAGASVGARDVEGKTPLHHVSEEVKRAAYLLIKWGADVTIKDEFGATAPDWVSSEYHSLLSKRGKLSPKGESKAGRAPGLPLLIASRR